MKISYSLLLLLAGFSAGFPAAADELITLKTRPEVTQSVLLWEPYSPQPEIVILLFPGGPGNVGLGLKDGRAEATRRYLFGSQRESFARPKITVVVIDAPSDYGDMDEPFRRSEKHLADVAAVVREIRSRFPKARLVLMAHSRGTVSAGFAARALQDQVGAVVLVSGRYHVTERAANAPPGNPGGPGLSDLDLGSLKSPVLLVHHARDACSATPPAMAERLAARLPLIKVATGVDETNPDRFCFPGSNHWLSEREKETIEEIVNWLSGKSWQRVVP